MFGQKKTNDSCVENNIFQKIGEYPLNIACILTILLAKNKCKKTVTNFKIHSC